MTEVQPKKTAGEVIEMEPVNAPAPMMTEHTPEKPVCYELSWPHTQPDMYDLMHRQNSVESWVAGHNPDDPYSDEDSIDVTYLGEISGENNARRLTACWNACAGIETEVLENIRRFLK